MTFSCNHATSQCKEEVSGGLRRWTKEGEEEGVTHVVLVLDVRDLSLVELLGFHLGSRIADNVEVGRKKTLGEESKEGGERLAMGTKQGGSSSARLRHQLDHRTKQQDAPSSLRDHQTLQELFDRQEERIRNCIGDLGTFSSSSGPLRARASPFLRPAAEGRYESPLAQPSPSRPQRRKVDDQRGSPVMLGWTALSNPSLFCPS